MDRRPRTFGDVVALIAATDLGDSPDEMRAGFARLAGPQPGAEALRLGPVEALAVGQGPTLLWFHGGGYVFGAPGTHLALAHGLAAGNVRVVLPGYRLAPEHPWPAMLDDALAALDALDGKVILGGDSAGGHLALNVALQRPGRAAGLALISPNTDRTGRSTTRGRETDLMNDDATDARLAAMAMPGMAPEDPAASPLLADLSGLPPLHLELAGDEILLDDGLLLARAAALAGARVSLHVTPEMFHLFPLWPDAIPEGQAALARIATFARRLSGVDRGSRLAAISVRSSSPCAFPSSPSRPASPSPRPSRRRTTSPSTRRPATSTARCMRETTSPSVATFSRARSASRSAPRIATSTGAARSRWARPVRVSRSATATP
nr:alpha/beta hydrolase fold domain-containing protein [Wenxinia marina]